MPCRWSRQLADAIGLRGQYKAPPQQQCARDPAYRFQRHNLAKARAQDDRGHRCGHDTDEPADRSHAPIRRAGALRGDDELALVAKFQDKQAEECG